jgi:hypothetical protein
MLRRAAALGLSAAFLLSTPVFAVTTKEKQETCKFGADDQKLKGAARKNFMAKCMANADAPTKPKRDKDKK